MDMENDNNDSERIYDISITYDDYYKCPRLWLHGTQEGESLT